MPHVRGWIRQHLRGGSTAAAAADDSASLPDELPDELPAEAVASEPPLPLPRRSPGRSGLGDVVPPRPDSAATDPAVLRKVLDGLNKLAP